MAREKRTVYTVNKSGVVSEYEMYFYPNKRGPFSLLRYIAFGRWERRPKRVRRSK